MKPIPLSFNDASRPVANETINARTCDNRLRMRTMKSVFFDQEPPHPPLRFWAIP